MIRSLKTLFLDKTIIALSLAAALVLVFTIITFVYVKSIDRKNRLLRTQLTEIESLTDKVVRIKNIVESKEKKIGLRKTKGVVSTLEQTLKALGLEASVIKPLEKKKVNVFSEDNAELEIRDTDLNSIVNLLYKIENSPAPMKIKSAEIKTTFEDPDKFILKLTVSLLSRS